MKRTLKRKKLVALFKAIEDISKRKPNEVKVQKSGMQYNLGNGNQSIEINILPTSGKYMLPEVQEIKQIMTSIEPIDLVKEVISINKAAGFPVVVLLRSGTNPRLMVLNVNTAYGAVSFMVYINPDEEVTTEDDDETTDDVNAPISDKELKALKAYAKAANL